MFYFEHRGECLNRRSVGCCCVTVMFCGLLFGQGKPSEPVACDTSITQNACDPSSIITVGDQQVCVYHADDSPLPDAELYSDKNESLLFVGAALKDKHTIKIKLSNCHQDPKCPRKLFKHDYEGNDPAANHIATGPPDKYPTGTTCVYDLEIKPGITDPKIIVH
jgi:hypothetical protein